jgi:ABC-type glycerol-3-phosphate transport system permease component
VGVSALARRGQAGRGSWGQILTYAGLTSWVLFVLFPLYWVVTMSFKRESDIFALPIKLFSFQPTVSNYLTVPDRRVNQHRRGEV